jgi:50S ribosomal protein L16 3-hydroxylase
VADEASSVDINTKDAAKMFGSGMSLLFNHAEGLSPLLPLWLQAIREDLGLSSLTEGRCLVYATPKGGGTAPHFDQNINFVVQLTGTKTWWLAPNRHVDNPLTRHTMGLPADPELSSYARQPLPKKMPASRREVVLKPGSLLVVPRGMWHATEAKTDALSLNFTFTAPSWLDVLTTALRGRLALSPAWRETATPSTPAMFAQLLRSLADDAEHWNAEEILDTTEAER